MSPPVPSWFVYVDGGRERLVSGPWHGNAFTRGGETRNDVDRFTASRGKRLNDKERGGWQKKRRVVETGSSSRNGRANLGGASNRRRTERRRGDNRASDAVTKALSIGR
ncbi:hypothetical protein NL676_003385 [Syzygium grande]|nr:hypothetical protein NL676_003385 [Syzygium grande]